MALRTQPNVTLHSSDRELVKGFERIKKQALHWVFEGYPVGDYYEAALPERDAFCMRDISHQCTGGEVLGLGSHNKNMFTKFVRSISEKRDYCGYWEIDRWDRPCPVDYKNDSDFWYNFPANFDVLYACWRMYEWTGDRGYLEQAEFDQFFAYTMEEYIKRWDRDGDGIPDAGEGEGRRGIASYDESPFARASYRYGSDLLAVMARAHKAYAAMCSVLGRREQAAIYGDRGDALLKLLNETLYSEEHGYPSAIGKDGAPIFDYDEVCGQSLLYWDTVLTPERAQRVLDGMEKRMPQAQIEGLSHYPEILWRYGRPESAMKSLQMLMDPACPRKEYPEASYCAIGAIVTGMMGVCPTTTAKDAPEGRRIRTLSGLTDTAWVEVRQIPVLGGLLNVLQKGHEETTVSWEDGKEIIWRAMFHGEGEAFANGKKLACHKAVDPFTGKSVTYADIRLCAGEEVTVRFERA